MWFEVVHKVGWTVVLGLAGGITMALVTGRTTRAAESGGTPNPEIGPWGYHLEGRDLGVDPQDDFFRYANGAWFDEFVIPEDLSGYGSFTKLHLRSEEQVKAIVEEAASSRPPRGTLAQKVGDIYTAFLDDGAREARGYEPLAAKIAEVRSAGTHDRIAVLLAEHVRIGGSTPFAFRIDQDDKDPTTYIPNLVQSGLGLPDRDYFLVKDNPRFAKAREAYAEYLETVFRVAGMSDPAMRAGRILELETAFAESHWDKEDTRDIDKTYNKMTRKELIGLAPGFPWNAYLDAVGFAGQDEFIVKEPSAYAGMVRTFVETPVEVLQDFLIYRLHRNNAAFLPDEIDEATFEFTSKAFTGAEKQRERWKRAVGFINGSMGEGVGRLYVERHFSGMAKERIDELVANLIEAMGQRIDGLDWMSEDTKKAAHEKLSRFVVKIGYPDEWRDYSSLEVEAGDLLGNAFRAQEFDHEYEVGKLGKAVDRGEWFMPPQTVNAYYNANMNEIVFPAAILQAPFFDPHADDAVNYGGIGAVIGHEIGHGFDDQGRKFDGEGFYRLWWTEEDNRRFQERAQKLVEQYDQFEPLEGMNVNGQLTLGENIGDLGGLQIAYHAYKLSLDGKEPPVLDGLAGDQRFFLGFAQIWRGKYRDELMAMLVASNPHSPVEFRVNGTLRNIDAWYDAFDVEPGDGMYLPPEERVRIW